MTGLLTLTTSVPPRSRRVVNGTDVGLPYQRECIEGWLRAGVRLISVNPPEEVEAVSSYFPELEIVESTGDARHEFGRPLVYISDAIDALKDAVTDHVGVVNADILFSGGSADLTDAIARVPSGYTIAAHRLELAGSARHPVGFYSHGFDLFVSSPQVMSELDVAGYAFGEPWWDYWLPLNVLLTGHPLAVLRWTQVKHLAHDQAWNVKLWRAGLRTTLNKLIAHEKRSRAPDTGFAGHYATSMYRSVHPDMAPPFGLTHAQEGAAVALGISMVSYINANSLQLEI